MSNIVSLWSLLLNLAPTIYQKSKIVSIFFFMKNIHIYRIKEDVFTVAMPRHPLGVIT